MHKTVTLSDNQPCQVRQLGLFELDGVGRELISPYKYQLLMATGQILEDEYDLRAFDTPPKPPDGEPSKIESGSYEWYNLQEFETYQKAIAHEKTRLESYEGHLLDISHYIIKNCISADDRERIVTADDYKTVYQAAIVPLLTEEVITDILRDTFQSIIWWQANFGIAYYWFKRARQVMGNPVMGT